MPNTPARLGRGITVWYATPETTPAQRAQASALLRALGQELEVDDERFVAMATAVSGTGPTYVFLVMEALIDAAVHLGFPRHIAHDLVIETLEGSTLFAKSSGMHPAELRNMVTSPGGTSAAALHELESGRLRTVLSEAVWAAFRRTEELGRQLEDATADPHTRARWAPRWAGPVAKSEAGGPDWSFLDHVAHLAAWQEMAVDYIGRAADTGVWPTDEGGGGGDFDRFNEDQRAEWAGRGPG